MRSRLRLIGSELSASYWFVPTVMAVLAVLLALAMVCVDSHYGSAWMDDFAWLYAARPDGARALLSAVGGSMIGVAGTTFSVTIAAVVYASGQFGPRLLSNFMSNRGNQVTLGTFIATFVYSLIVLRTIRSAGEGGTAFVPQLAVVVAVVLVAASIAVLIYFIHHVPQGIHINSVIEGIGARLMREIDNRFPVFVGEPLDEDADEARIPEALRTDPASEIEAADRRVPVRARDIGYVQIVDDEALLAAATSRGLVLRMQYQPGDFAHPGSILIEAWPPEACDDATIARLRGAFVLGNRRTPLQDMGFLIDELVEIAARALSPGVNDPFTAVSCLDWLGAALADLARRDLPSRLRADSQGDLRVIARPMRFAAVVERSFGALAQYASADMIAGLHYLASLGDVLISCDTAVRRAIIRRQAEDFRALADAHLNGVNRARVLARGDALLKACDDPRHARALRDGDVWLGGTA